MSSLIHLKQKKPKPKEDRREIKIGSVVCRKYLLIKEIGKGTFGNIFLGKNTETEEEFAVKIENINQDPLKKTTETLLKEAKILFDLKGERGFPRMYYFIKDDKLSIMVLTLLQKNLAELWKENNKKFSLKTVLISADQMLTRLEFLHTQGYIHRDIKPENFMIGTDKTLIHLIDFGLSKKYLDENGQHILCSENIGMVGTARYTSVYSHLGFEHSRRDDLESLGYLFIYLLKGKLPWMNIQAETKNEKHQKIGEIKMKMTSNELCKGLPIQFLQYFDYIKNLSFSQEPNYLFLKKLFRTLLLNNISNNNMKFDWEIKLEDNKLAESLDTFGTDLADNKRKPKQMGGRLKPINSESNQLKVIFKTSKSKSMRTTKDDEEIGNILGNGNPLSNGPSNGPSNSASNNGKESCTSSKSALFSNRNPIKENENSKENEIEDKIIEKLKPNIKIITPPTSQNEIICLKHQKSLKISKNDMFNKLSTMGFPNRDFEDIDESKEEKQEDINSSYMNEYHKRLKVRDLMKNLEKNKVIVKKFKYKF